MATIDPTASQQELLSAGWEALERTDWTQARGCFEGALARETSAEALEGLAWAVWWLNEEAAMFRIRERAYALYRRRGDRRSAGRLATLLGIDYYSFRAKAAVGNGWFRRAHRLLEGLPPVPEHGWLSIWEGQIALIVGNDPATARRLGAEAAALGRSLEEVDIEMTGLALEGLALVTEGAVEDGMPRLDEATAAAIGGEMSEPWGIGATCCYLIYACERVRDSDRAVQWCERVQEFCRELNWVSLFATCRTHHAGLPAGAYTVWWVIFDTPSGCSGSCGEDDLFNPDASVSIFWATGGVVPGSGVASFRARHRAGESLGEPGIQHILGDGSLDPSRAEIHNVIKYHGPASDDPDTLASQIYTLQGSCFQCANAVDLGDPFGVQCFDPQAVAHPLP